MAAKQVAYLNIQPAPATILTEHTEAGHPLGFQSAMLLYLPAQHHKSKSLACINSKTHTVMITIVHWQCYVNVQLKYLSGSVETYPCVFKLGPSN